MMIGKSPDKSRSISMKLSNAPRKGMALLVVVVLVMLISLGAYRFSFYMESQYRVTRTHEEQIHARLAAMSGLDLATAIVELPLAQRLSIGGLENNESVFRDILVSDRPLSLVGERDPNAWRFCLVSPRSATTSALEGSSLFIRFGLENEASKLHIPTLLAWDRMKPGHARIALLGLPGANEAIVDAWLRELGASNQVNRGSPENQGALLDNIRQAWFGGDLNQNYQLDPMERRLMSQNANRNRSASGISNGLPNESVALTPLQRYLTWYSGHRNLTRNGTPRVNLNDPDLSTLHRNLSAVWSADRANFVIAMRQFGPGSGAPNAGSLSSMPTASPQVETVQNWSPDLSKSAVYTFRSPLDLVGAVVDLPPAITSSNAKGKPGLITSAKRFVLSSFSSDLSDVRNYLNNILDTAAIDFAPISVGRIDAYEAPLEVLAGVPGLDLTLAQRIVQHRSGAINTVKTDDGLGTIAWLVDVMELAKLKELEPYLTGRSDVYSVQSIGYRDNKSAVYRITAVIDASENPTQLRNSKIWQPWDRGFSIDELIGSKP